MNGIQVEVGVRGAAALASSWRRNVPAAIEDSLGRTAQELGQALVAEIREGNLDGAVLRRRSGRLAASIAATFDPAPGHVSVTIGSDAPYAAFQEYGFHGIETVRQHLRAMTEAFGRPIRSGVREVLVRTYRRRVDYPAHSFLRSALAAAAPELRDRLVEAVAEPLAAEEA